MGPIAYIIKARVTPLRDLGSAMSPFNGFQFIQGLETLPLRMRAHSENGAAVAEFFQATVRSEKLFIQALWMENHGDERMQ